MSSFCEIPKVELEKDRSQTWPRSSQFLFFSISCFHILLL